MDRTTSHKSTRKSIVIIALIIITCLSFFTYFLGQETIKFTAIKGNALRPADLPPEFVLLNTYKKRTNDRILLFDEDWKTVAPAVTGSSTGTPEAGSLEKKRIPDVTINIRRSLSPREMDSRDMLENRFTYIPRERWKAGLFDGGTLGIKCYSFAGDDSKGPITRRVMFYRGSNFADITVVYFNQKDREAYGGPEAFIDDLARKVDKNL